MSAAYHLNVFINCPFDSTYKDLFEAIVFTVHDCGFSARSALEISDSSQVRIEKITRLIAECGLGIHDLSRTELDDVHHLPRFNMPLELGIFLGAKWLGTAKQKQKMCLVLDRERYRYQKFCSDISGQDVAVHGDVPSIAIRVVRDWLRSTVKDVMIPSGKRIMERYLRFQRELPVYCESLNQDPDELTFDDYLSLVTIWLGQNPPRQTHPPIPRGSSGRGAGP